jgi:hypothetical protein
MTELSKVTDFEQKFNEWFNEQEGFGLRSERFYTSINHFRGNEAQAEYLVRWLQAAYKQGAIDAAAESVNTLLQCSTACARLEAELITPAEKYEHAAFSLISYFKDVLK